jgi:RES domain-containing protein
MLVYRIEKEKYLSAILEGISGKDHDFRWNTKGHPIIYTSESRSLALHEKGGNLSKPLYGIPGDYLIAVIEIPGMDYDKLDSSQLPVGWDHFAEYHPEAQRIGDDFTQSKSLALFVPSTMVRGEFNVLLNPRVIADHQVNVTTEPIDPRLLA